jgi:hypothetical protein
VFDAFGHQANNPFQFPLLGKVEQKGSRPSGSAALFHPTRVWKYLDKFDYNILVDEYNIV